MSGRGNVGGGLFDAYGGEWLGGGHGARSGRGGFARAGGFGGGGGGGGGGGRRPWQGGDGPQGHRWEDPRRDGRVQKNRGRGRGRGGRGRGGAQRGGRGGARGAGQAMANKLNTWTSDQHYQKRESGAREQPEGVNFDAQLNRVRAEGAPLVEDGLHAVENRQRDRLMHSRALQYEAADVKAADFVGMNLEARNVHSLMARADRTQPQGTRYNVRIKAVRPERGLASSEAAKQQLFDAMLSAADPFEFDPDQKDEVPKAEVMEVDRSPRRSADREMEEERRNDAAEDPNYQQSGSNYGRRPDYYYDA
ncbi:hypothetical protein INS49_015209 [Diaporthe citri]|uniref:uncharacterized protein n=1 Tax=Diaporthe citri TaxID=83186 RepID=UPI001C815C6E|nr:uncharacterized protein INS49_015209 [Diaporthe citri]KAG6357331.1 hypothetical protein INS49_015209 [Diaporthe citri]